ncbi:MAG TPA: hypothetical protein VM370_09475 [Candidatus Thermoplasmatota archaeon]|nr:hypothetical protein [Candidatus Thermoplasmatota archaeon]
MRPDVGSWSSWDIALQRGDTAEDTLAFLEDEELIDLLATGVPSARAYELRLVATELTNRLVRFRRLVEDAGEEAREGLHEARRAAGRAEADTAESANGIQEHMELRQDRVADEPASAHRAQSAARETREAVDELRHAEVTLSTAREEIGRRARRP